MSRDAGPIRFLDPPVAVLVSRFPRVTETFILREIDELERQGQSVRLVPLIREEPPVVHRQAVPWVQRALYTPWLSLEILASLVRTLARRPGRFLWTKLQLVLGTVGRPSVLLRTLVLFPKAVYLGERLATEGISHLHAHFATYPATVAWVASRLFDLGFSFTIHAHDLFVDRSLLRLKVRDAELVRAISHFNRRYLEELYPRETEGKVRVIHMGIEPERYGAGSRRGPESEGKSGADQGGADQGGADQSEIDTSGRDEPRLLCVAALEDYKGIPVLLAACQRLARAGRRFRCDVVGEGSQRRSLEREIRRRDLADPPGRVRLLGACPQDEVARRLGQADVFVLPSVVAPSGQMEGIPVVLMEALASRVPVVTTRLSGIPELVEDGVTGLLVEPGNAEALAAAVGRLLDDLQGAGGKPGGGGLARRLTAAGRRQVEEEFNVRSTAAQLRRELAAHSHREPRVLHEGPDAVVTEAWITDPTGEVRRAVIKRPRERAGQSRPARQRARWEHEVLTRLHAAGLGVPRPLGLVEDATIGGAAGRTALAMEWVPGVALVDRLRGLRWGGPRGFRELETAVASTGIWLRRFQEATAGGLHGDLWPGNVRFDRETGEVRVLDLEGFVEGKSPLQDAAHFLVTCGLYLAYPLLARRHRRLERAFLEAWRPGGLSSEEWTALERERAREARQLLARRHTSGSPEGGLGGDLRGGHSGLGGLGGLGALWRRRWLRRSIRRTRPAEAGTDDVGDGG